MKINLAPEIHVKRNFLEARQDIITKILFIDNGLIDVEMDHPVLGKIVEIFVDYGEILTLKGIVLLEMESYDETEIARDYYNNYCLNGEDTYLSYYHPEIGYYLSSRNY